jgi:hypothetical protein
MNDDFKYWTTSDGNKISIEDLETNHIINIINGLKNKKFTLGHYNIIDYTGDGDGDGAIYGFIPADDDYINTWIEVLTNELNNRPQIKFL